MDGVNRDVIEMARGLVDSRVVVKRPPSAAQRRAYHATPRGPPLALITKKARPFSAKARITTESDAAKISQPSVPPRPPWKHSMRAASLSTMDVRPHYQYGDGQVNGENRDNATAGDDEGVSSIYNNRSLPESISALLEWLTDEVPSDWAQGYDPESSFVFLPSLYSMTEDLPCVPMPQGAGEPLAYTPVPKIEKYKPPKPRKRIDTGQEKPSKQCLKPDVSEDELTTINHIRMYDKDGELIHDIYRGKRPAEIIRQEIEDLERLLQGIGNPEGSSIVVRYQHDINHLQDMVKTTLNDYVFPDQGRPQIPAAAVLQEDLMQFPAKHDEIITSIQQRRDECVEELAAIERKILHG